MNILKLVCLAVLALLGIQDVALPNSRADDSDRSAAQPDTQLRQNKSSELYVSGVEAPKGDKAEAGISRDSQGGTALPTVAPTEGIEPSKSSVDIVGLMIRDVIIPVLRLGLALAVLLIFVIKLELPAILRRQVWTEKTVLAFSIVFTFCAAALMGAEDSVKMVKDLALVVIGFYFGSAKSKQDESIERENRGKVQDQKTREDKLAG